METGIRPVSTAESLNKVICKHLFAYMLAYMGKSSYLCSVIKKEIVKQLKIQSYVRGKVQQRCHFREE